MSENTITTSATTKDMQAFGDPRVIYKSDPAPGTATFVVTPHPPTPRPNDRSDT